MNTVFGHAASNAVLLNEFSLKVYLVIRRSIKKIGIGNLIGKGIESR